MDFYDLLTALVDNTVLGEPNQKAAREVIKTLKGVNAFGTVVAGTQSETQTPPHAHRKVTQWHKYEPSKLVDVCTECGEELCKPYEPTWQSRKW